MGHRHGRQKTKALMSIEQLPCQTYGRPEAVRLVSGELRRQVEEWPQMAHCLKMNIVCHTESYFIISTNDEYKNQDVSGLARMQSSGDHLYN